MELETFQNSKFIIPDSKFQILYSSHPKGQAVLPAILLICGIITEIAVAGALVAFILSSSGWGERLSSRALAAAKTGVEDAFMKITLNKNFSAPSGYSIVIDGLSVLVVVNKDCPVSGSDQVISLGQALSRQRK